MRLSELKTFLTSGSACSILLPDGSPVPSHFHVTEIGETTKSFVDCGGKLHHNRRANLQLWTATDYDHRLEANKLLKIIGIAEDRLGLGDLEVQVEYQGASAIEIYGLEVMGDALRLVGTATDCLALADCDIPATKTSLNEFVAAPACSPGGGCC